MSYPPRVAVPYGGTRHAEPGDPAAGQRAHAVEAGDHRQLAGELAARVVLAGRDHLVDVLDGYRIHLDDDLALASGRIGKVLIPRD